MTIRANSPNHIEKSIYLIISFVTILSIQCKRAENRVIKDIDGNKYKTVLIGNYWWMAENLRTSRYNDGSEIPLIKEQSAWLKLSNDAYCYYLNDINYADTLGFLYNWYSVNTGKLCPDGWRIPTDEDWKNLEGFVDTRYGIGDSIWNKPGLRGFDAGQRLKSTTGWRPGVIGTDNYGFSALPGGERLSRFYAGGSSGFWWSSSEASQSSAYYRSLIYSFELVARDTHPKRMGFSVRCLKDKQKIFPENNPLTKK
jgi:uncharacterized protein (TIGR02145 family)